MSGGTSPTADPDDALRTATNDSATKRKKFVSDLNPESALLNRPVPSSNKQPNDDIGVWVSTNREKGTRDSSLRVRFVREFADPLNLYLLGRLQHLGWPRQAQARCSQHIRLCNRHRLQLPTRPTSALSSLGSTN